METLKTSALFCLLMGAALLPALLGCAGKGALVKVIPVSSKNNEPSIEDLEKDWDLYYVRYNGIGTTQPRGLLFDPKGDDRRIVGRWWHPVQDRESLSDMIGRIASFSRSYPMVQKIVGSRGKVFGYIFCDPWYQVPVKELDERILKVFDLEYQEMIRHTWLRP